MLVEEAAVPSSLQMSVRGIIHRPLVVYANLLQVLQAAVKHVSVDPVRHGPVLLGHDFIVACGESRIRRGVLENNIQSESLFFLLIILEANVP